MREGWIALHRAILEHWLAENQKYFYRFVTMLLQASWKDTIVELPRRRICLKRGQLLSSTTQLMREWKTNNTMVGDFLDTLQNNNMIKRERSGNFLIITIVNYDKYQAVQSADDIGMERTPLPAVEDSHEKPLQDSRGEGERITTPTSETIPSGVSEEPISKPQTIKQDNNIKQKTSSISPREIEEKFFEELKGEEFFIEQTAKALSTTKEIVRENITAFFNQMFAIGKVHNNLTDAKSHCYSWIRIQLDKKKSYGTRQSKFGPGGAAANDRAFTNQHDPRRGTDVGKHRMDDYGTL